MVSQQMIKCCKGPIIDHHRQLNKIKKKTILHFVHSKITEVTSKFSEFKLIFVTTVHDQQGNIACIYIEKCILINILIKNNYYFTAVSDMT